MTEPSPPARPRGRPVSPAVDKALLDAALEEFTRRGYHALTMEAVAARAGVSKVSLYRRWSSKSVMVAELFRHMVETIATKDKGSLEADLRDLLHSALEVADVASRGKIFFRTLGEISDDSELMALYRQFVLSPRLDQVRRLVERAQLRGELRPSVSPDFVAAMIGGPIFLFYFMSFTGAKVDLPERLVDELTTTILKGVGK